MHDGTNVGVYVEIYVGEYDGTLVGRHVGKYDGSHIGFKLNRKEGILDGVIVDEQLGKAIGISVLGSVVGAEIGSTTGVFSENILLEIRRNVFLTSTESTIVNEMLSRTGSCRQDPETLEYQVFDAINDLSFKESLLNKVGKKSLYWPSKNSAFLCQSLRL